MSLLLLFNASGSPDLWQRSLTIDHTLVPNTDQTDFPVLVSLTHADLKTIAHGGHVANSNGYDILFFSDSGLTSQLAHEIEGYDPTTGEIVMWVKIPTVSHTTDTIFYMKYGDTAITTSQESVASVWSNNYVAVYHLSDGITLEAVNSVTGSAATISGPTASAGQVDGGATFGASSTDKITTDVGAAATLRTYTIWAKRTGVGGGSAGRMFNKGTTATTEYLSYVDATSSYDYSQFWTTGASWRAPAPSINVWHHVAVRYDSTSFSNAPLIDIDGTSQTVTPNSTPTGSKTTSSEVYVIGNRGVDNLRNWAGDLDEFHIADVIRSDDWIDAEVNNQSSPSSFVTLGVESEVGAAVDLVIQNSTHSHTAQNSALTQVHSLALQNASHTHSAGNLALTQAHSLVIQNAAHSHTAASLTLTQTHALVVQSAGHSHSAGSLTLTQVHGLTVANAVHSHTGQSLTFTQVHSITIASSAHAQSAESPAVTISTDLAVQSTNHGHSAESLVLTGNHVLTISGATHVHSAANITLTQTHSLSVQNADHTHSAQSLTLTQAHQLILANSTHAHSATSLTLTQSHDLTAQNASHAHSAENVELASAGTLGIQSAAHHHSSQSLTLTQTHSLATADSSHSHTAGSLTISVVHHLAIQTTGHQHSVGLIELTGVHFLTLSDSSHAHSASTFGITQSHILIMQSVTHNHSANAILLNQVHSLTLQPGAHQHFANGLALDQEHVLTTSNSLHSHTATSILFITVARREQVKVSSEARSNIVASEARQSGASREKRVK